MNSLYLLADPHFTSIAEIDRFTNMNIFKENLPVICLGDFTFSSYVPVELTKVNLPENFKLIGGNHDDYPFYKNNPRDYYLGDYGMLNDSIGYIRGAKSKIDMPSRLLQKNARYFSEEELTRGQFKKAHKFFIEHKPKIMLSHEAPLAVTSKMYPNTKFKPSLTEIYLQEIFEDVTSIESWYFGHHHRSVRYLVGQTQFTGVHQAELTQIFF